MKKMFGLCAVITLIGCGVVLSDEVKSIVEQNDSPDAAQAVDSAINASEAQPVQEALPEEEVLPKQEALPEQADSQLPDPSEVVEESLSDPSQTILPATPAQYIIGVIASPIPPMVRAQVNLPGESGLFVQTIKPNGPAAKAGFLPYDIIVSIDGVVVSDSNDLSAELQKAAGKPQKLTILRHGKELTLDITAQLADAPRQPHSLLNGTQIIPAPQPFIDPLAPNFDPDEDEDAPAFPRLQRFMDHQRQQMESMRQRMEAMENAMRQGMPGFMPFPGPDPTQAPMPTPAPAPNGALTLPPPQLNVPNGQTQTNSFSVQIQKNGNAPAVIKIQDNDDEYIVDENTIDQLPENVRKRLNFKSQTNDK